MTLPEHTRQPLGPNQERWIQALESGKYKQGKGSLRSDDDAFCCLGVGCEVAGTPATNFDGIWEYGEPGERPWRSYAPDSLKAWLGLYGLGGDAAPGSKAPSLVSLNDDRISFPTIAAIIRSDPSVYFKEPR